MAKLSTEAGTRVAPDFLLKGKISGEEDLVVAGRLEGTLSLGGTLYVEPGGVVRADVSVERAVIAGIVVGNVTASESIQITAEGRVLGDLSAPRVAIAEGGRFAGAVEMGEAAADELLTHVPRAYTPRPRIPVPEVVPERRSSPPEARPEGTILEPVRSTLGIVAASTGRPKGPEDPRRRKRIVVKKRS